MSHRSLQSHQEGFTLVELMVVIVLVGILSTIAWTLVNTTIIQYFGLQKNSTQFTDLATQSQRIANVLRGTTDIITPSANDLSLYAYFSPNNTYVSQIHYYLNSQQTTLYADVTPMTANPPIGTPIAASKKTYTIISNFYQAPGVSLFNYLNGAGTLMPLPVSDEHTIKGIIINLAVPDSAPTPRGSQTLSLQVSLRNRKTNL